MRIKQTAWFAAGPEVRKALLILSDGGFRLYFYLCLNASRATGRTRVSYAELALDLARSRRSIASYFDELRAKQICVASCARNQHSRTEVEICDDFWPYTKEGCGDTLFCLALLPRQYPGTAVKTGVHQMFILRRRRAIC